MIASVTTSITILAGAMMTVVDRDNFPSIGSGMWWAVQTVTTVGYGDHVPVTAAGQIVAAVVMLLGIGFVTVITASITGAFVARSRAEGARGTSRKTSRPISSRTSSTGSNGSRPGCASSSS